MVDDPLHQRVLDPACGSGTFIETAVERILEHAGKLSATETLRKLQDNVVPDFFPMPASVVFAEFNGVGEGTPLAPGDMQVWHGNWRQGFAGISRKSEALHHDDGKFKSPYAELSNQGPTIVDRRPFFVETMPHTVMLPAANTTNVRARQGRQDNIKYDGQLHLLDGVVHNDHLFDVYLGKCVHLTSHWNR